MPTPRNRSLLAGGAALRHTLDVSRWSPARREAFVRRAKRKLRRMENERRHGAARGCLTVEVNDASDEVAAIVEQWFISGWDEATVEGGRAALLTTDAVAGLLKIKGSGSNRGGRSRGVEFGVHHDTGPVAPMFDFDGRMAIDVASGHDEAFIGGATFQQAATEFRMAKLLESMDVPVVPCVGWGSVTDGVDRSWFSLHDTPEDATPARYPHIDRDRHEQLGVDTGRLLLRLATEHHVAGHCWAISSGHQLLVKDLHPFRHVDPLSASQLTWAMSVLYGMHLATRGFHADPLHPPVGEIDLSVFRCVLPDVTREDHDQFRFSIVQHHMKRPPKNMTVDSLLAVFKASRLATAMLDHAPEAFARP